MFKLNLYNAYPLSEQFSLSLRSEWEISLKGVHKYLYLLVGGNWDLFHKNRLALEVGAGNLFGLNKVLDDIMWTVILGWEKDF